MSFYLFQRLFVSARKHRIFYVMYKLITKMEYLPVDVEETSGHVGLRVGRCGLFLLVVKAYGRTQERIPWWGSKAEKTASVIQT